MRIAIIGSGISGIAAAKVLKRLGHDVIVFERQATFGGVWAQAYAGVGLQSLSEIYGFSDFPWPDGTPELPSGPQILSYIDAAIAHYGIAIAYSHNVVALDEEAAGWQVGLATPEGEKLEHVDAVVVAAGHYTHQKVTIDLPGRERFKGKILADTDMQDPAIFDGKRVAVVGFGKSGIDMVTFAAGRAAEVHHVFRGARWLLPRLLFGKSTVRVSVTRMSTFYMPSWVHPGRLEALMHRYSPLTPTIYSAISGYLLKTANGLTKWRRDPAARRRLALVNTRDALSSHVRGTTAPDGYFEAIAKGTIEPHQSGVVGFSEDALLLADGTSVPCDIVVLSLGYKAPALPFLPEPVRAEFAATEDGVQLYRHVIHPRLKRLAFAGFNHNPLHVVSAEIATLWAAAVWNGDIVLPSVDQMERSRMKVRDWKRAHVTFEPTRAYWVSNRFHQYLDVLLMELGVRHKRKPGLRDIFDNYRSSDYAGVLEEHLVARGKRGPMATLLFDT